MAQKFLKEEALGFGWKKMKENFWFLVSLLMITLLIELIPSTIATVLVKNHKTISLIVNLVSWLIQIIISIGVIKIFIDVVDGKEGKMSDLFTGYKSFFNYLFGSILYSIITFVGLILFIIPGIIWSIQFQFFTYFIVDKGAGPIEALKMSSEATKGEKWNLSLFGLLIGIINLAGLLCLILGLFATIPMTLLANAFVYRKLSQQMGSIKEETKEVQAPPMTPAQ